MQRRSGGEAERRRDEEMKRRSTEAQHPHLGLTSGTVGTQTRASHRTSPPRPDPEPLVQEENQRVREESSHVRELHTRVRQEDPHVREQYMRVKSDDRHMRERYTHVRQEDQRV